MGDYLAQQTEGLTSLPRSPINTARCNHTVSKTHLHYMAFRDTESHRDTCSSRSENNGGEKVSGATKKKLQMVCSRARQNTKPEGDTKIQKNSKSCKNEQQIHRFNGSLRRIFSHSSKSSGRRHTLLIRHCPGVHPRWQNCLKNCHTFSLTVTHLCNVALKMCCMCNGGNHDRQL